MLRWTRRAAEWEHELAETVVHAMPPLFAAWAAGEVDRQRVRVFTQYLCGLPAEQVTRILAVAVPRAPRLTTGQLAVLLRRMVIAVDPEAAARWYRKGVRERNVVAVIGPDGTVTMSANGLPADEAEAACVRVQDLAQAAQRAGHPGLVGQIRCDVFLGMLDGRFQGLTVPEVIAALIADYHPDGPAAPVPGPTGAPAGVVAATGAGHGSETDINTDANQAADDSDTGHSGNGTLDSAGDGTAAGGDAGAAAGEGAGWGVRRDGRVGIEIRAGLATVLGLDERAGEIPGLGLLPAPDTRHRIACQRRAQWRFAVTGPHGQLLSEGLTRHRPDHIGPHPVEPHGPPGGIVELHIPLALLEHLTGPDSAAPAGWAALLADVAAQHADRDRRIADLDARPHARFPGAALRRHTQIRDRHCTFPGCRHPARHADVDHTRDHALGGHTRRANTGPLCGHDHDVKTRTGWTLTQPEPGTFRWRSPLGGTYLTRGEFADPDLPEPCPTDLGPDFDRPTRVHDGPILQPRPRPPDPPPSRPPPRPLPDEPPF
ncbi:HNH endonuclease signature motif containing protein [Pseudonocardia saturnea]